MKIIHSGLMLLIAMFTTNMTAEAIEISNVTIDGEQVMTFGADPNTVFSNNYSVVIKDAQGNGITESTLNSTSSDFTVTWDIEGFKTANDTEGQYCDSYGSFSVNGTNKLTTSFDLRDVPMNFYGRLTATVTYGGTTVKAEKYVVALGDKSKAAGQLLPLAGYPKDFSSYPNSLEGYTVLRDTYGAKQDIIIGGWSVAGSDAGMSGKLLSDADGTKYVRFTSTTAKKSHIMTTVMDAFTGQVIYITRLRFPTAGATITLTQGYPMWQSRNFYNPVTVNYDGTNISLNGVKLQNNGTATAFAKNTWYNVILSADKSTESCYCLVYDTDGTLIASAPVTAWTDSSNPTFFSIGMQNSTAAGSVDIASCQAYIPTVNTDSYSLTADKTTLSIPNGETAQLTASVNDTRGYQITQKAIWSVLEADMQSSVIITPSADDSHNATISLSKTAEAGTATIQVSIGGYSKTIALTLTSSTESVKFTQSTTSITIPLDAGNTVTAAYAAIIADGNGADLGRAVTLTAYGKDGVTPFSNTDNINFNPQTGILSVTSAAAPTQLVIKATGLNTDGEQIAKTVTVNIHGMKFDFGYSSDNFVADGYTAVDPQTRYTETNGYGIVSGTPAAGGSASATNAGSDYLDGTFQFDFKVQKGNFYTVNITYQGTLKTGYVNSDLAGYTLGTQTSLNTVEYTIPATLDIIDLQIVPDATNVARIAQISISKQPMRQKRNKPVVHHIGDSTSANSGSWARRLDSLCSSGSYTELTALCDFKNNGRGGRNLSTYYTEGLLAAVLADIYPGDIVMFGNMGTNGMGNTFEADVNYYLDAAEALGAKIIMNSYTPHGAVSNWASGYNSSTNTFDSYRRDAYDVTVRKIAAERAANDENYLGFVEIGKNADAIFNAYTKDYAANSYASADAAAQAIITCFTDHNHYSNGTLACDLMLNGYSTTEAKGIVQQLIDILNQQSSTGLSLIPETKQYNDSIFDLHGRKMEYSSFQASSSARGIYIVNGKKYGK